MEKFKEGQLVKPKDLEVDDMFWMTFGYSKVKFRVLKKLEDECLITCFVNGLKSDTKTVYYDTKEKIHYAGRKSKSFSLWFY